MPTETSVIRRIHALRQMTVAQLRCEWERLHNEPSRSRNREFLYRRLAWRVQELQHGGLSRTARDRIDELAPDSFIRTRTLQLPHGAPERVETPRKPQRDPRLPSPGTVIVKAYKGRELRLLALDDGGFELDGARYGSLTEAAKVATGSHWNGRLFWGLVERKRKT